jgi:hypothetical protein
MSFAPRRFPLLLGTGKARTQGKAGNQDNAVRIASGHIGGRGAGGDGAARA